MSGQKTSVEIVTEQELGPSLLKLNVETFLRLYNEWKATHDPTTFAALRTMHENAGYNNKAIMPWTSEQEMHEIAAIVQRFKEGKVAVMAATVEAGAKPPPDRTLQTPAGSTGSNRASGLRADESIVNEHEDKLRATVEGEVDPDELESFANESLKLIDAIPNPEMRRHASEFHASILIGILRSGGYNIVLKNGRVGLIPKPGVDAVNLSKKFQTLVDTRKISMQTLSIALLYNSPGFRDYAKMVQTGSGKEGEIIISPNANLNDFMKYLRERRNAGDKYSDTYSLLGSESVLKGISIQNAIKGLDYWDRAGVKLEENNALTKKAKEALDKAESAIKGSAPATSGESTPPRQPNSSPREYTPPAGPNTRLTGFLSDKTAGGTGGSVSETAKLSVKGITGAISDIMSIGDGDPLLKVGLVGALIYGAYKLYKKVGFFKGTGILLGMGFINNADAITKAWGETKWGKKIDAAVGTATKAGKEATVKAAEAATEAAKKTTEEAKRLAGAAGAAGAGAVEAAKKRLDEIRGNETPSQSKAAEKVRENKAIAELIAGQKEKPKKNASLEEYLAFIHTSMGDLTMTNINSITPDSIFSTSPLFHESIKLEPNLDPLIMKRVLRLYLTGVDMTQASLENNPEHAKYRTSNLPWEDKFSYTDTLSVAIGKIYK